ncbi:MAG TPA: NAD(P)H-dependent oxidoreductase [Candidatus Babeliales bacterium]|nr:NAD(P)H-dependent oxidoreductase [Candidatus Babeliales bacterium]
MFFNFGEYCMSHITRFITIHSIFIMLASMTGCCAEPEQKQKADQSSLASKATAHPMMLYIIVASTRPTKTGVKIAKNIKAMMDKRPEVRTKIINIADYNLPFYTDEVAPADRKEEITNPAFRSWADKVKQAAGYIIVSPEYNYGYPASLKNALDSLYKEWNNKPVGFVGYSGGSSGGASMIAQLRQVARGLKMIPVAAEVKIPQSWKAFNDQGGLANSDVIEKELNIVVNQLLEAQMPRKNE